MRSGRRLGWPDAGLLIGAVAAIVLGVGVIQAFAGAASVGITTDEPTQASRMQGWLTDGWFVPEAGLVEGEPAPGESPYVYGPAFGLVAHGVNVLVGNESGGEVSTDEGAWTVRHLVAALIGVVTAIVAGLGVWMLTASRRFALWTAAALLAVPIWLGMSFFNPKDVPAAAGYTLFTVGLIAALAPRSRSSPLRAVTVAALVGTGLYLGAGTRLALWAPLVASAFTFGLLAFLRIRVGGLPRDQVDFRSVGGGLLVGVAALALSYPAAFSEPLELLSQSLSDSSDYPWAGLTLTAGELLDDYPPWWYLPAWSFASTPVLLLCLAIAGGAAAIGTLGPSRGDDRRSWLEAIARRRDLAVVLVLQQALLVPVASIVTGANMYSGLRQHLYLVPAIAMLAGLGAHEIWRRAGRLRNGAGWPRWAAAYLLSAALVLPMAEGSLLFPYNYSYVNPIAGLGGVNDRWETDFWGASFREALSRLPGDAPPTCSPGRSPEAGSSDQLPIAECSAAPTINPYLDEREGDATDAGSVLVIVSHRAGSLVPSGCIEERNVTRWLRGEDVVMSYVARCPIEPPGD